MQNNNKDQVHCYEDLKCWGGSRLWVIKSDTDRYQRQHWVDQQNYHEHSEWDQEHYEPFVVPVP